MISRKAIEMIIKHEVGGRDVYNRRYQKPIWAGGDSGVTIGLGYDVGYVTEKQFFSDWEGLNLNFLNPSSKRSVYPPKVAAIATVVALLELFFSIQGQATGAEFYAMFLS